MRTLILFILVSSSFQRLQKISNGGYDMWYTAMLFLDWSTYQLVLFYTRTQNQRAAALDRCSKTSLQFVIKNCTDLTVLWLQHLYNLVHVDLSYNSLKVLEAAHTRLGNIKTLSLAGNQLDQLTGLTKLYSLVNLDLSHNQLAQVITLWMSRWSRCPSDVDAFKDIFFFRLYCKECKTHFPHILLYSKKVIDYQY